ncbi:terminase large subunit [Pseudoduganella sp. FT26W]|uniref:Terminase large subunit n=1 Tax=Duganella aquatilis TaxID=2666082 RepID=A0A844DD44_9BURK|nr:terminase large subunit [Duganella aquatilis]MRW85404.1 terminase large subunit [Duganella aquatilis]
MWTTACPDWATRLRAGETIIPPPIFPDQAEQALAIFKQLKIVDAPGSPTFGESCAEWVFDLVRCIFGAYDADTGRRLIVEFFVLLPKKNSKSTVAAGIMMTALILNWRQSAEFSVLAPTVEVANNAYTPARDMVQKDDDLDALMHVQSHVKTITHRESNATLKVLAADQNTVGGKKSVGTLVDELHLFGKIPSAENMFREALGGRASRPEGFVIWLTTQSDEPPAGVFKQKLDYARKVRDGEINDPSFVPIIFEHPPEMVISGECLLLENMAMVNPNIGFSVDEAFLEREFKIAQQAGPESFRGFMSKHANVEIGLNLRSDRWAGAEFWEKAAIQVFTLEELVARCEVATVGIDGGGLDDLLGLAVTGRERGTGRLLAWFHAWAHEIALERRKEIAPALLDFVKQGDLTIVKVPGDDVIEVADFVCQVNDAGLLPEKIGIGVDAAGIIDIVTELVSTERGITMEQIISIRQGYSLNGAIKSTERQVAAKTLVHAGRPMMNWCVGNARIEDKGNAILVTKAASGKAKIDPLMALFNAVSLMALNPVGKGNSVYETRGIRMI